MFATSSWQRFVSRHRHRLPKSILCIEGYSLQKFFCDLTAGITVGLVAIPLAMAFAISAGVPPQSGLYCAAVAGFLISALGGSRTQVGGPTGAFVVVVFAIVAQHGVDGLFVCTFMSGVFLLIFSLTGLGNLVRFIPRPVIVGFTNGIAVLIASTQIKDLFGLSIQRMPGEFAERMQAVASHISTISWSTTLLAATSILVVLLCGRFLPRLPGAIVALLLATIAATVFALPVETIGTRFGGIPAGIPSLSLPTFDVAQLPVLLRPALTLAMLGAIESLMSAVVADRMSGDKHQPNVELAAQGVANLVAPLFGGLPATGAIARTAMNVRSGAKTPVAGMIHGLTVLVVLAAAAPLAQFVPLGALAAILMLVAYNMGEWREIPKLLKLSWADKSVWLTTFALTVFADLTLAVEVGMVLAALLFIRKVTRTTTVQPYTRQDVENSGAHVLRERPIPEYVGVFRIQGPFLFGASEKLADITHRLEQLPKIIILRLRDMTALDATGLMALEDLASRLNAADRALIVCDAQAQPAQLLKQARFQEHVGRENVCTNIKAALERAERLRFSRQAA